MGCLDLHCTNTYSWAYRACVDKHTMRFKNSRGNPSIDAIKNHSKEESTSSENSSTSTFSSSTKSWPPCQIPLKKQWRRRQALEDDRRINAEKTSVANSFSEAQENSSKNELESSSLVKKQNNILKASELQVQTFSPSGGGPVRPKPKGLVDGLSRFFTPTNKRKSRVAISSLGDSLTLEDEIQVNDFSDSASKASNSSFSSKSDTGLSNGVSNSLLDHSLTVKPSGSGQLKNLFDGLSHLFAASTDTRKRAVKNSPANTSTPSPKRQRKLSNKDPPLENDSSVDCDKSNIGDSQNSSNNSYSSNDNNLITEGCVDDEEREKPVVDSDSSMESSDSVMIVEKPEKAVSDISAKGPDNSWLEGMQVVSVLPENKIFGSCASFQNGIENGSSILKSSFEEIAKQATEGRINVTDDDKSLFKEVQETAQDILTPRLGLAPIPSKPSLLQFGKYEMSILYQSPYPREYLRLSKLFLCEFCLKYMKSLKTLQRHTIKCKLFRPPADEIYRKGDLSVFEVDGSLNKTYCQNLCLLSKLFLNHKTLFFDVEPFLFYVLTKNDKKGCHLVGYFSKERYCQQRYNVSCIIVMPQHQKKGYGRFLIDFSYLLSRKEGRFGTPEKPLSALGRICYTSYWESVVLEHLNTVDLTKRITIKSICKATGMTFLDVVATLTQLNIVTRNDIGKYVVTVNEKILKPKIFLLNKKKSHRIVLDSECLNWKPKRNFKTENCKKCRKETARFKERKRQYLKTNNKIEKVFLGGLWYSKDRIKCETCLLSQERERRKLLKQKNKRKLTSEKHLEMETVLGESSKKKRVKLAGLGGSVLDSSDDSIECVRYTSAKIKNMKRKLLRKHKLKMQRRFLEQKHETDILKYSVTSEHKNSKIKVHSYLHKTSKVNIECERKLKHRRREKKDKKKNSKDKRKHKPKEKKKDCKSSDGVRTPPVLLPAVLSDEDGSSNEANSASEHDLLPPPLLQALVVECIESKVKSPLVLSEPDDSSDSADVQLSCLPEEPKEKDVLIGGLEVISTPVESFSFNNICIDHKAEELRKSPILSSLTSNDHDDSCSEDTSSFSSVAAERTNFIEASKEETVCQPKDAVQDFQFEELKVISNDSLPQELVSVEDQAAKSISFEENAVDIEECKDAYRNQPEIYNQQESIQINSEPPSELKPEEENEVREAVEALNEQMEHTSDMDLPLTPQTPESSHSGTFQQYASNDKDDCMLGSDDVQEIDDISNNDCQVIEDIPVHDISDDMQECSYSELHKSDIEQSSGSYQDQHMLDQPEIVVDLQHVSQPLSHSSQMSNQMSSPSTPIGTIVSKHTPTPQEMSNMGVYTPDSSTNSGYNSVEIDVCQLGLESPTSVCSSEMAAQNSVEPRSSPAQSYSDCAQLNNSSPYCVNATMAEHSARREMMAAAAAAQAAVVQAQAQAHHSSPPTHCSNRKRQHHSSQRIAPATPVSGLAMQSSMVSVNATAVNALFVGPNPTNNGYMNMNMSVPCTNSGPVAGGYMVGLPVATVIQPQSFATSMQNHHQLQQSQNFSVGNHTAASMPSAMQRLTHVGMSPSVCPASSVPPNFHIQSPSYTYTPTPTPTPNAPSQIGTSCSLAKLQQLTNGIMDIVPNPSTMTPPPNMTPPSPQVDMTPPPQRSLTPSQHYSKYHFHHRQMQRSPNVSLGPNLVAWSNQTINGVGYRIQQAPPAAMLNTGYITNASFINQAQLPQMGMVNVNMHGQSPYQEANRPQNAMYATYSYHISGNLQPQSLNSVMRR